MQFSPEAFNRFLGSSGVLGQRYNWFKSAQCPCIDRHSGAAKAGCPLCFSKGRLFSAPVAGVAGMSGARTQREWAQYGVYESGDIVITIPENTPLYDLGQYDRVTALNATNQFSLVLTSGDPVKERLFFTPQAVSRVFWISPDGKSVVEGGIPVVASDGRFAWDNGGRPPIGANYTICGTKLLDYFCFGNFPSSRNMNQGSRLPRKVVLRDFDLFNR